jgi:hypothetical protein
MKGSNHIFITVDYFSGYIFIKESNSRKQACDLLIFLLKWLKNKFPTSPVSEWISDGAKEFVSNQMEESLRSLGIEHTVTPPYHHHKMGKVERVWRTLINMVRTAMISANLPIFLWAECFSWAAHVYNRTPHGENLNSTPYEILFGQRPRAASLRTWGCVAYVHIPVERQEHKLIERARQMFFIGYSADGQSWRFWDRNERRIIESSMATFMEDKFETEKQSNQEEIKSTFELFEKEVSRILEAEEENGIDYETLRDTLSMGKHTTGSTPENVSIEGESGSTPVPQGDCRVY